MKTKRASKKTPVPRKQDFTTKDVREIADWLVKTAKDVDGFAKSLEDSGFDGVMNVDGGETMRQGVEFIGKWLSKCKEEFNRSGTPAVLKKGAKA